MLSNQFSVFLHGICLVWTPFVKRSPNPKPQAVKHSSFFVHTVCTRTCTSIPIATELEGRSIALKLFPNEWEGKVPGLMLCASWNHIKIHFERTMLCHCVPAYWLRCTTTCRTIIIPRVMQRKRRRVPGVRNIDDGDAIQTKVNIFTSCWIRLYFLSLHKGVNYLWLRIWDNQPPE